MLHIQTVKGETFGLLTGLMQDSALADFDLAGGTALALYLGHRMSIDLDLFASKAFDAEKLGKYLFDNHDFKSNFIGEHTLMGYIDDVKVDFITHAYPSLDAKYTTGEGIRLISMRDIAAMKLSAIAGNGTRLKDFIDVAFLSTRMPLSDMLSDYERKYADTTAISALRSLTYFDDINHKEPIPIQNRYYDTARLCLYIPPAVIHLLERERRALTMGGGCEVVFLFEGAAYLVRASALEIVFQLPAARIDPCRDYVEVFTVNVLMEKYDIWLLAVTHALHIVDSKVAILLAAQRIVGMGIQGYVDNGFSGVAVGVEPRSEPGQSPGYIAIVGGGAHLVREQHPPDMVLLLVVVVFQRSVKRFAACNPYNHLLLNSSVFAKILPIRSPILAEISRNSFSIQRALRSSKTVWRRLVTWL
jgi:hypothetical protein